MRRSKRLKWYFYDIGYEERMIYVEKYDVKESSDIDIN